MRAIGEVAELRLPQDERGRVGEAVAVFEADHGRFRERAVDDLERRLSGADMVDRDVAFFGLLVDQHGVAMREGAAPAVLTGHPDMGPLGAQRGDRQRLGGRPVDAFAGFDRGALCFQLAGDLGVEAKALRHRHEAAPDLPQRLAGNAGIAAAIVVGSLFEPGPGAFEPIRLVRAVALRRLELTFRAPQ